MADIESPARERLIKCRYTQKIFDVLILKFLQVIIQKTRQGKQDGEEHTQ